MASRRSIKKDIDYLVQEIIGDSYLTLHFHPGKKSEVLALIGKAVDARNDFIQRANNPAEKKNRRLVRKHYAQLRRELMEQIDGLFSELSAIAKK